MRVAGVPVPVPYLLRRFSKPKTIISWRARVATRNATQRGPGRTPPPPSSAPAALKLRIRRQAVLAEEAEKLIALGEAPTQHGAVAQHLGAQRDHLARTEVEAPVHFVDRAIDLRPREMRVADGAHLHARVVHQTLRLEPSLEARLVVEGGARIGRGQRDLYRVGIDLAGEANRLLNGLARLPG